MGLAAKKRVGSVLSGRYGGEGKPRNRAARVLIPTASRKQKCSTGCCGCTRGRPTIWPVPARSPENARISPKTAAGKYDATGINQLFNGRRPHIVYRLCLQDARGFRDDNVNGGRAVLWRSTMLVTKKWGNSPGLRIPSRLAAQLRIVEKITADNDGNNLCGSGELSNPDTNMLAGF